jgi:hypothetical protein
VSFDLLKTTAIVLTMSFPFISSAKGNYENKRPYSYDRNAFVVRVNRRRNGENWRGRGPSERGNVRYWRANGSRQRRSGGRRINPCMQRR